MKRLAYLVALLFLLLGPAVRAESVGVIVDLQEPVTINREEATFTPKAGDEIRVHDVIQTGTGGKVKILFDDDVVLYVAEETVVEITKHDYDAKKIWRDSILYLRRGLIRSILKKFTQGSSFRIVTQNAVAGAEGTDFLVRYTPEKELTEVYVLSGKIELKSSLKAVHGVTILEQNHWTEVSGKEAPGPPRVLTPGMINEMKGKISIAGRAALPGKNDFSPPGDGLPGASSLTTRGAEQVRERNLPASLQSEEGPGRRRTHKRRP